MRHYNIPTRLLDWTESPLIAAYFATNSSKPSANGAIWALSPLDMNIDTDIKGLDQKALPTFDEDEVMETYTPEQYELSTDDPTPPIAFLAPRNTTRMQVQLSVFTIHHKKPYQIDKIVKENHIWKYIIPKSAKKSIADELKSLKINRFQLYPELESIQYKILEDLNG